MHLSKICNIKKNKHKIETQTNLGLQSASNETEILVILGRSTYNFIYNIICI